MIAKCAVIRSSSQIRERRNLSGICEEGSGPARFSGDAGDKERREEVGEVVAPVLDPPQVVDGVGEGAAARVCDSFK